MAENVGSIYYSVEADTSKLVSGGNAADASLDQVEKRLGKTDKTARSTQMQLTKTAEAVQGLGREANSTSNALGGLGKLLGGFLTLQGARGLIDMAEAYNEMAERVQMATSSTQEYELVQQRLLNTANKTYRALSEAQEVYILTADSVRSLGYSTEQALDITDSLSYSFVKNATSVQRADSAVSAFTKALNKGKVEVEGWESLVAAIPTIVGDIGDAAGKSSQEIRELGVSGGITAQMLTEGLRRSLDENRAAADGMATTLKDAFRNLSNNLSVYIGEANRSSGATGLLSSAIVGLGENIDTVVKLLTVAGAGALAKYVAGITASTLASGKAAIQARIHAAEQLRLATAEAQATAAAAAQTAATARMGGAHSVAAAAAARHAAAQTALAAAQRAYVAAGGGLLSLLGGPAGIIALVASAAAGFVLFGDNARDAVPDVNSLTNAIDKLGEAQLRLRRQQAEEAIEKLQSKAQEAGGVLRGMERDYSALADRLGRGVDAKGLNNATRSIIEQRAEIEQYQDQINSAQSALTKINDEIERRGKPSAASGGPAARETDKDVQKRLQGLRDERELVKLTGEARAKLQAVQRLGANATAEERAEAERLAAEIYRLEAAQKKAAAGTGRATEADKANAKVLNELAESLRLAGLSGEKLAVEKAKASLNKFATAEEVAQVEELARALFKVQQLEEQRKKFGDDPSKYVKGDVKPLSGGEFDEQTARYDAEAKAEKERYAEQLKRLQEYQEYRRQVMAAGLAAEDKLKQEHTEASAEIEQAAYEADIEDQEAKYEVKIETETERNEADLERLAEQKALEQQIKSDAMLTEEELFQEHAKRMEQIEQAKNSVLLKSGEQTFGAMADAVGAFAGRQSGLYKAMFAASKAFAIADAAIKIQQGIAGAWALPYPANIPAVAQVVAGTASILGSIASVSMGGGKQYGGPVAPNNMYRINETGAPEVLNLANGQQFLLPNQRGEVVSNRDATRQMASPGSQSGAGARSTPVIALTLNGSWFSDKDLRRLVADLNEVLGDGAVLQVRG